MRVYKEKEIRSVDDWFLYAPPKMGARHWKDGRSAKELARSWFRNNLAKPPEELVVLLEARFGRGTTFHDVKPECTVQLDEFDGEQRNCDLVALCKLGTSRAVIHVEAKADEPFGDLIGEYFDRKINSVSNVPERIRRLSLGLFGREPDEAIRKLRYQLLHATAAALIDTKANDAEFGLLLIHEFRSASLSHRKLSRNGRDWADFVHTFPELATARIEKDLILGPISVPGGNRIPASVPLYRGKLTTELTKGAQV